MKRTAPNLIRWDVNSVCNMSCAHCCVANNLSDGKTHDLSHAAFVYALEKVADSGVKAIHLLGGEPTIRPGILDIFRVAKELGLVVSYNTNGIRQDDQYLDSIFENDIAKVVVSLDGYDADSHERIRGKGTFAKSLAFIKKLIEHKHHLGVSIPKVQIQAVLTSAWASNAWKMIEFAYNIGADSLKVNQLAKYGNAAINTSELYVDPKTNFDALIVFLDGIVKYPSFSIESPIKAKVIQYYRESRQVYVPIEPYECPAISDTIYIESDGTVAPCQLAHAQGMGNDLPPLRITEHDAEDIWKSPYLDRFAERVLNPNLSHVYRHMIPCNRCIFLGKGCKPCPLPEKIGYHPTHYTCLIAEALIEEASLVGGHSALTSVDYDQVIENILASDYTVPPLG